MVETLETCNTFTDSGYSSTYIGPPRSADPASPTGSNVNIELSNVHINIASIKGMNELATSISEKLKDTMGRIVAEKDGDYATSY